MPAPTNQTAPNATVIASLPASISQNVHDAGTTYTVWYKYTAVAGDTVIGIWGFGDLTTYTPDISVYLGPDSSPVIYLNLNNVAENKPIQIPVTAGVTYWFEFTTNSGNPTPAVLLIEAETAPTAAFPVGTIIVPDDSTGFPLALLSPTTNFLTQGFIDPFPHGEQGDVLADGYILVQDSGDGDLKTFTKEFVQDQVLALGTFPLIRTNRGADVFYVARGASPITVSVVDRTGSVTATHSVTETSARAIAASNDETILYHGASASGGEVRRWDLVGDAALSDLTAGIANFFVVDILVLDDDTIIVAHHNSVGTLNVHRYNASGTLLNTYTFAVTLPSFTFSRLAYSTDPLRFWVWTHLQSPNLGTSRFHHVLASDGTIVSVDHAEYETAIYEGAATATPTARFGISFSCPFFVMQGGMPEAPIVIVGPPPVAVVAPVGTPRVFAIRRQRTMPHLTSEQVWIFYHRAHLDLETGTANLTGDGTDPQVMLDWSDDGGFTWSQEKWRTAGRTADWALRALWRRLGRSRDRIFRITVTDPIKWAFIDFYLKFTRGKH